MNAPAQERIPAAKVGWLLILLTLGWVIVFVAPWPAETPAAEHAPQPPPVSKLQQVGLSDNPDWDGLPEYFAVWADNISWGGDNRTAFAYWHPGSRTYSYFFEVTRSPGGYRFRLLNGEHAEGLEHLVTHEASRGEQAETHPFVFPYAYVKPFQPGLVFAPLRLNVQPEKAKTPQVKVEVPTVRLEPPKTLDK